MNNKLEKEPPSLSCNLRYVTLFSMQTQFTLVIVPWGLCK